MIWKLNKTVYGLCDSSRAWYFRVKHFLISLGMVVSKHDQAMFLWHNDNGLCGIVCIRVDDFFYAGTTAFHSEVIKSMQGEFMIGSSSDKEFKYIGINLRQTDNGISISQEHYIDMLKEICP